MSDWGWVALAYGIVYGTLLGYVVSLVWRRRRFGGGEVR
jgi:hypothetical protein